MTLLFQSCSCKCYLSWGCLVTGGVRAHAECHYVCHNTDHLCNPGELSGSGRNHCAWSSTEIHASPYVHYTRSLGYHTCSAFKCLCEVEGLMRCSSSSSSNGVCMHPDILFNLTELYIYHSLGSFEVTFNNCSMLETAWAYLMSVTQSSISQSRVKDQYFHKEGLSGLLLHHFW